MADHPSIDDLADVAEGLLDPDRSARVAAHLAGCARCQEASAALSRVSEALAAAPQPSMPDAVAARLGAVLGRESDRRLAATAIRSATTRPGTLTPQAAGQHGLVVPHRTITPHRNATLGHFTVERQPPPLWRRWAPALAAAALATTVGFGGYVLSATAGLNEPPVLAAAVDSRNLGSEARSLAQSRDLDPHRFSRAWFCARSVTRGRITGLAGARVDGSPALLVYVRFRGDNTVTVVRDCNALQPSAIASAALPR